jgi:hypothetical protein
VERRKIKSGSSAATAEEADTSTSATAANIQRPHCVSYRLEARGVMVISVGKI